MVDTVIFDMGGTLEDVWVDEQSTRAGLDRLREMLITDGAVIDESNEEFKRKIENGWHDYGIFRDKRDIELKPCEIWGNFILKDIDISKKIIETNAEKYAHMWELTHYHRCLRDNAHAMLDELKADGMKLGIISNTSSLYQVFDSLEEYGIRACFSDITLSSVTGFRKPGAEIFKISLEELHSKPENSIYVGDTVSRDVEGAKKAGLKCSIMIHSRLTDEKDTDKGIYAQPDYTVHEINEVCKIVRHINNSDSGAGVSDY